MEVISDGPGQGSEFVVRLPLLPERAGRRRLTYTTAVAGHGTGEPTTRALRVLVVDDKEDTVLSFSMLLKASGHDVRTAHFAQSVLGHGAAVDGD